MFKTSSNFPIFCALIIKYSFPPIEKLAIRFGESITFLSVVLISIG